MNRLDYRAHALCIKKIDPIESGRSVIFEGMKYFVPVVQYKRSSIESVLKNTFSNKWKGKRPALFEPNSAAEIEVVVDLIGSIDAPIIYNHVPSGYNNWINKAGLELVELGTSN